MRKTGTGGGSVKVLDEVDLIILDILGKNSKVVDGLGLPESGCNIMLASESETEAVDDITSDKWKNPPPPISITATEKIHDTISACSSSIHNSSFGSRKRKSKSESVPSNKKVCANEAEELRVELFKAEIYHRKLQILKLEKELGLPYSAFTRDIVSKSLTD